ncbi:hypothetical protein [Haliangium sp.]|uniref:hypothetical protein n=1 Tax=Haliangium sp. TaxID=2663208 RepID=UPI003D0AE18A
MSAATATRRLVAVMVVAGVLAGVAVGCGGPSQPEPGFSRADAVVLVRCNVPDAELWIDERFVGQVSSLAGGVAVRPGRRRVEVRHHLHHTFYEQIELGTREQLTVDAVLVPVLP